MSAAETLLVLSPELPQPPAARLILAAAAGRAGMSVISAAPERGTAAIEDAVLAADARAVLVCGDGPTQASAACVAAALDRVFACLPSSAADMLARDIGAPVAGDGPVADAALDLGEVNGITFVNYVAIGLRVHPTADGARVAPAGGRERGDADGVLLPRHPGAPDPDRAVLVCNNRFEATADGIGARQHLDAGRLAILAWHSSTRGGALHEPRGQPATELELRADGRVWLDIDGAGHVLHGPLRFRSVKRAVRLCSRRGSLIAGLSVDSLSRELA